MNKKSCSDKITIIFRQLNTWLITEIKAKQIIKKKKQDKPFDFVQTKMGLKFH